MAARCRDGGGRPLRDGIELPRCRSVVVVFLVECSGVQAADLGVDHDDGTVFRQWREWLNHYDGCRRIHHDDGGWRLDDGNELTVDADDGRNRTSTRAPGPDAVAGQLDQPNVHNDRGQLEHRLGVQVRPCSSGWGVVPGVRHARRIFSDRDSRNQRNRADRAVGDGTVLNGIPDIGGASPAKLHLGRQDHRFVVVPGPRHSMFNPRLSSDRRSGATLSTCLRSSEPGQLAFPGAGSWRLEVGQSGIEVIEKVVVPVR